MSDADDEIERLLAELEADPAWSGVGRGMRCIIAACERQAERLRAEIAERDARIAELRRDLLADAEARIKVPMEAIGDWQPIETAPTDRYFLAWYPPEDGEDGFMEVLEPYCQLSPVIQKIGGWMRGGVDPTRWRPLPEPPK